MHSLPAWNGVPRRWQENEDWAKAGIAIKQAKGARTVVAEQLARFIGGDRVERMKTVEQWVRGGYHATMGHAFEFPDGLSDLQADYNEVVADSLPEKMDIMANKQGNAAAAEECKRLAAVADKIEPRLRKCDEFRNEATKTEMLSRHRVREERRAQADQEARGPATPLVDRLADHEADLRRAQGADARPADVQARRIDRRLLRKEDRGLALAAWRQKAARQPGWRDATAGLLKPRCAVRALSLRRQMIRMPLPARRIQPRPARSSERDAARG